MLYPSIKKITTMQLRYFRVLLCLLPLAFVACDDYLDVNTDPNRVTEATLEAILPTAIEGSSSAHYTTSRQANLVTQHIGSYFGYTEQIAMDGPWTTIYLRNVNNLQQIINQGTENGSPHYVGVAKVLMALNLGLLTDNWEDAPYSEALQGSDNFQPRYDAQEAIYTSINTLLEEAIVALQAPESVFRIPTSATSADLIYRGDLSRWMKAAYSLQARYAIHLANKGAQFATAALDAAQNGFDSNDDDLQLLYNAINRNPWHTGVALGNNTGNFTVTQGSYLVNSLNGAIYGYEDPRLPLLADKGANENFVGMTSYDEIAPGATVNFTVDTWHSTEQAPILMSTFSELKFIEAEAALRTNAPERAYAAYLAGIEANMQKLGVEADDITAYLGSPDVAVGANNLTMGQVMKEKYIALHTMTEAWVDMRRFNYSNEVYRDFVVPDPAVWNGPAQRSIYPVDEVNRNGTNVQAATKAYEARMWRDQ